MRQCLHCNLCGKYFGTRVYPSNLVNIVGKFYCEKCSEYLRIKEIEVDDNE